MRDIARPNGGWSPVIRYHRGRNALLVVATNDAGEVRAVQFVYLTADGCKISKEEAERRGLPPSAKQTFGVMDGTAVRLPGKKDALALAEGPETALSVWSARGLETWIALGSIGKIQPPPSRRLVVCADDDPRHASSTKSRQKAIGRWRAEGYSVAIAMPWPRRREKKSDFNDVLRTEGPSAVVARIEAALVPPRSQGATRWPIDTARHDLHGVITGYFQKARSFDPNDPNTPPPITHGIRADVGTSKTSICRIEIVRLLVEMRGRGDMRTAVIAVPTHKLGDGQAQDFEKATEFKKAGFRVRVWRGREAPDPSSPDYLDPEVPKDKKTKMCRDLDAVKDAQLLGLDVDRTVCRSKKSECVFAKICGYQRAKSDVADIWIVPHELLFSKKPEAIGDIAILIVDEAAWADGLEGIDGRPIELALDCLRPDVTVPDDKDGTKTEKLRVLHQLVRATLDVHLNTYGEAPLRRDEMKAAGVTHFDAKDAHRLSWDRVVNPGLFPGMPADKRKELVMAGKENRTAMRTAKFFKALKALVDSDGPDKSGWISLAYSDTEAGRIPVVRLRGRRDVAKGWHVPTLLIDALLDRELVRPYWPNVMVTARIGAQTPHMRVRQLTGRDIAKTGLVPDEYADEAENKRRLRRSMELRAVVFREARKTNGRVLVVALKAVREHWESLGSIPGNIEFAHHNAVAGRDEWGPQRDDNGKVTDPGVAMLIVVGRTLPKTSDVERMTEALTGAAVSERANRYERVDAVIAMADGTGISTETDQHPDPMAEAVRWQICEGEIIQIIGRPRAVNRTAANPVDVLILTDRPLPLPIDETVTWEELAPTATDLMMNLGGVALENAADAAEAYPEIWDRSVEAAKKAMRRQGRDRDRSTPARCGTFPLRYISIGESPAPRTLTTITYQRRGSGCRLETGVVDLALVPDPRTWLEGRLGALKFCCVEGTEPSELPAPQLQASASASGVFCPASLPAPEPLEVEETLPPLPPQPEPLPIPLVAVAASRAAAAAELIVLPVALQPTPAPDELVANDEVAGDILAGIDLSKPFYLDELGPPRPRKSLFEGFDVTHHPDGSRSFCL